MAYWSLPMYQTCKICIPVSEANILWQVNWNVWSARKYIDFSTPHMQRATTATNLCESKGSNHYFRACCSNNDSNNLDHNIHAAYSKSLCVILFQYPQRHVRAKRHEKHIDIPHPPEYMESPRPYDVATMGKIAFTRTSGFKHFPYHWTTNGTILTSIYPINIYVVYVIAATAITHSSREVSFHKWHRVSLPDNTHTHTQRGHSPECLSSLIFN